MSIPFPTSSVAAKFAQIIDGLRFTVPKFIAKDRNAGLLIILVWSHLGRLGRRFAALAARAEAGILRTAPQRRAMTPGVGTRLTGSARLPSGLPTGCGWLGDMMWEARSYGAILQQLLAGDPEMAALIAACPQAGRIVRSILWMTSRTPVPAILRVSRSKRVPASPLPLWEGPKEGPFRRQITGSRPVDGPTPPSVPPTRGGRKKDLVPPSRGGIKGTAPYRPSAQWPRGVLVRPRARACGATGPPAKA